MRRRASSDKNYTRNSPKLEDAQNKAPSVTDRVVTRAPEKSPTKRYERLRPWIDLANTLRDGAQIIDPAPPEIATLISAVGPRAANPAVIVFTVLQELAQKSGSAHMRINEETASTVSLTCEDGVVRVETFSPLATFFEALVGIEAARLRVCPICNKVFYALRITQMSCSRRCNQTRRVRERRKGQARYEQNRKFKLAGVRPEGNQQ
jgi:hypothetical protein